jgi:outer membrane protein assembly factor BamB
MKAAFFLLLSLTAFVQDWTQFRGPTGQGVSDERGLPLAWSESKNVRWKVAIPGSGWSSPAILGDHIWLTTATEEGRSLRAVCVNRDSGAILHNLELFRRKDP